MSSHSRVISLNLLPTLTAQMIGQWKGKVGQVVSERRRKEERRKEDGAELHGLEKPQ